MSANPGLQRLSLAILSQLLIVSSATRTHRHRQCLCHLSFPPWIPSFIYPFICLSFIPVMLSFTRLLSRLPPLSSSSLLCQSLFPSLLPSLTPYSVLMPLLLKPSPLLFIHHRPLPPPCHSFLLPADDVWCDGDWLRGLQREETAGMCCNGEWVVVVGRWSRVEWRKEWRKKMDKDDNIGGRLRKTIQGLCGYILRHIGIHNEYSIAPNSNATRNVHTVGCCRACVS